MANLLITELYKLGKEKAHAPKRQSFAEEPEIKPTNKKFVRANSVYYGGKLPKLLEKSTESFLDFMINQETKYANLNEIENFISNEGVKHNIKYNLHQDEINQKQKRLDELDIKIEREIKLNKKIDMTNIDKIYEERIKNIEHHM